MHVHDLHATILHLMGIDHEKLTYRYSGRDFRLTDVSRRGRLGDSWPDPARDTDSPPVYNGEISGASSEASRSSTPRMVPGPEEGAMSAANWTTLSEVPQQPVQWLWEGRVPRGKVTLLDGEPGFGKSLLALDLAARVSQGRPMPMTKETELPAGDVVLFNGDDSLADTVRPRLEEAGADLTRIRAVDCQIRQSDLLEWKPTLIIVDPLSDYLCHGSDVSANQAMRELSRVRATRARPSWSSSSCPRAAPGPPRSLTRRGRSW